MLVPPEEPQEARGMNMKTSPQERTMNTNTELPKNARMLTKEEADDWDKICSDFDPIFLEVDGEIREFERISSCPSPVLGKGFLVLAVSCPEWGKEKLMIVARCKEGKEVV